MKTSVAYGINRIGKLVLLSLALTALPSESKLPVDRLSERHWLELAIKAGGSSSDRATPEDSAPEAEAALVT